MNERSLSTMALVSGVDVQLLEQLNDEEFWAYAAEAARTVPSAQVQADEYILCELSKGYCLLPLSSLREIVPPSYQFTLLPAAPIWMLGIAAWRGEAIVVIDLEAYLANSRGFLRSDGMLLVAQCDDLLFGMFITAVGLVTPLAVEQIRPPDQGPAWCAFPCSEAVRGVYNLEEVGDALVLDISALSGEMVQRLRVTNDYG